MMRYSLKFPSLGSQIHCFKCFSYEICLSSLKDEIISCEPYLPPNILRNRFLYFLKSRFSSQVPCNFFSQFAIMFCTQFGSLIFSQHFPTLCPKLPWKMHSPKIGGIHPPTNFYRVHTKMDLRNLFWQDCLQ